jgi:hypothetical protein
VRREAVRGRGHALSRLVPCQKHIFCTQNNTLMKERKSAALLFFPLGEQF